MAWTTNLHPSVATWAGPPDGWRQFVSELLLTWTGLSLSSAVAQREAAGVPFPVAKMLKSGYLVVGTILLKGSCLRILLYVLAMC